MHARAGDRPRYQPVESVLSPAAPGDAVALLRAYRRELGAAECYVADLDAIQGGAVQRALLRELTRFETGFHGSLLVDAGTARPAGTLEVLACGASQVVVGLETLRAFADLAAIVEQVGPSRVVFSLDLRLGNPVIHPALLDDGGVGPDAASLAGRAVDAGICSLLMLDVGRVGAGCGVDLGLIETLRGRLPGVRLLAGGGVLARRDLDRMRDAGCDAALVASALHAGQIGARDVAALQSETSASR